MSALLPGDVIFSDHGGVELWRFNDEYDQGGGGFIDRIHEGERMLVISTHRHSYVFVLAMGIMGYALTLNLKKVER